MDELKKLFAPLQGIGVLVGFVVAGICGLILTAILSDVVLHASRIGGFAGYATLCAISCAIIGYSIAHSRKGTIVGAIVGMVWSIGWSFAIVGAIRAFGFVVLSLSTSVLIAVLGAMIGYGIVSKILEDFASALFAIGLSALARIGDAVSAQKDEIADAVVMKFDRDDFATLVISKINERLIARTVVERITADLKDPTSDLAKAFMALKP